MSDRYRFQIDDEIEKIFQGYPWFNRIALVTNGTMWLRVRRWKTRRWETLDIIQGERVVT